MNNNQLQEKPKKFSMVIQAPNVQNLINNTLGEPKRAARFISAISSAVATNPQLQKCEPNSIINAGLLGESLNLSPSPQLGQYYMVPYYNSKERAYSAQFQMGYKGYIQLAIRSGQYRRLNVVAIKEGELVKYDPLNEEIEVKLIANDFERENAKTIGYYAFFEYVNGFKKTMYWSFGKMLAHADKYSQAFSAKATTKVFNGNTYNLVSYEDYKAGKYNKADEWLYSSFWYKDFDGMAYKTMLRQLISKWGIMSLEMERAYVGDQGVINSDLSVKNYVDVEEKVQEEINENANKGKEININEETGEVKEVAETETYDAGF
jgi:recombination protein RecT